MRRQLLKTGWRLAKGRLPRYIYIIALLVIVMLPAFFAMINKGKGLYVIGVKYHNELLSVGYCRAEDRENITYLSNSIKQTLLSNSSMNIINKVNQGIKRAYNSSCFFNTVIFAPALENVTYSKLIAVKNTIIIYLYVKPYGTVNTSRKDILVIEVGNNVVNLYMIALMFPFTMSLKDLVKRFTDRERQPEISHYLLLIGLSYASLSLFIQFMIWLSSGFQVTVLEILMLLCSFTLILVISTPQIILYISRLLCQISEYLCLETTELKGYTLLTGAFLLIFLVIPLAFFPPFLENIRISSTVAIGISVVFTIMLMLLNINNIDAIIVSYQIMLTMMTFILTIEFLTILVLYYLHINISVFMILATILTMIYLSYTWILPTERKVSEEQNKNFQTQLVH